MKTRKDGRGISKMYLASQIRRRLRRARCAQGGKVRALLILCAVVSIAQVRIQKPGVISLQQGRNQLEPPSMVIETSPELANLMSTAQEAIDRKDWKLAIDSLQRIVDDSTGSLVESDADDAGGVASYESARRYATRRLADLPSQGLSAYRTLFDGKARGMFDRGRESMDHDGVRRVADRYLLTSSGDDAAELLASWALDEGRASEAIGWLNAILSLVPDSDIPPIRLYGKLAMAYAMLGRIEDAEGALRLYDSHQPSQQQHPDWLSDLESAARREHGPHDSTDIVRPALLASTPWRYDLEGTTTNFWRRLHDEDAGSRPLLVEKRFVVADGNIFVRTPGGCRALNGDDLSLIWEAKTGRTSTYTEGSLASARQWLPMRWLRYVATDRVDPSTSSLSAGGGLVFVIETTGESTYLDRDEISVDIADGQVSMVGPVAPGTQPSGTRLVALEASTGELRWSRGRTVKAGDRLGSVRFRSTPIVVGDKAWVPYYDRADFYVAVLRVEDGALVADVLLGSISDAGRADDFVTPPGYSDGVVYVPSGVGVLFAVDSRDYTLRWASKYRSADGDENPSPSGGWIPEPPLILGDTVVLAPPDSSALLAFSAATGSFRWSTVIEGGSYLIDSDTKRVWVGGRTIAAVDAAGGDVLWKKTLESVPTGRGVRTGGVLNIPVADGLEVFEAATGEQVDRLALGNAMFPLGHIARVGSSLVSFDPSSVRRYPDLDKVFEDAKRALAVSADDVRASAQLAWSTFLQGDAKRAYEIATEAESRYANGSGPTDDHAKASLARVRLESLFVMSQATDSPTPETLARLREVCEMKLSRRDRFRCRVRIAESLARSGDPLGAYRSLFDYGLHTDKSDEPLRGNGLVRLSLRRDLAGHLRALRSRMSRSQVATLESEMLARVDSISRELRNGNRSGFIGELQRIADLWNEGLVAQRCFLALADDAVARRKYERAEQYLAEVKRTSGGVQEAISARLRMCSLYGESMENVVELLVPCLDELDRRYGSMPVPAEFYRGNRKDSSSRELVGEWVAAMRSLIPKGILELYGEGASDKEGPLRLTGESAWSSNLQSGSQPRIVRLTPARNKAISDRVILFDSEGALECIDAARGGVSWKAELALPGDAEDSSKNRRTYVESNPRYAVLDGQTVVVNAGEALFGVGMITGRRLWARRYDVRLHEEIAPYRDGAMAGGDGYVAALPRDGYLSLLRARDGSTVWERDLRGEAVRRVWMSGERIITADAGMTRAHIFDRVDGRLVRKALFAQPNPGTEVVSLVTTGGVLCGPQRENIQASVVGIDTRTGEDRWRFHLSKPVAQLFEVAPGHLGIGMLGGEVKVIETQTGEVLLSYQVPQGRAAVAGAYFEGSLILAVESMRGNPRVPSLVALDIATGDQLWVRDDIRSLPDVSRRLSITDGVIPAFVEFQRTTIEHGNRQQRRSQTALVFVDPRTGATLGEKAPLRGAFSGNRVGIDLAIHGEFAVLATGSDLRAFRIQHGRSGGEGGL